MRQQKIWINALVPASQLLMGTCAGYIAYMRGIQKGDYVLIISWFVLVPLIGLTLPFGAQTGDFLSQAVLLLASPFVVLIGFQLSYNYRDIWRQGWPFGFLSGAAGVTLLVLGMLRRKGLARFSPTVGLWVCGGVFAASVLLTGSLFMLPIEYKTKPGLRSPGQGILNRWDDDLQVTWTNQDGTVVGLYLDGVESPREAIVTGAGRPWWLDGFLLELLGKNYEPQEDTIEKLKQLEE